MIATTSTRRTQWLASVIGATLLIGWASSAAQAAEPVADSNVNAAIAAAKTPEDHQALAAFFTAKAEAADAEAAEHDKMATAFSGKARARMGEHCKSIAKAYRQQMKDYTALAKEQQALAGGK
ncbi:MAG TPA: hypothetical protein VFD92_12430 [Candidatus Binatia bacterium]|nr:hypothetical protein [Candidatus Binatia bacterium]